MFVFVFVCEGMCVCMQVCKCVYETEIMCGCMFVCLCVCAFVLDFEKQICIIFTTNFSCGQI